MDKKLTPEQRIEKILEILNLFSRTLYQLDGDPEVIWASTFNEVALEIDKALTAEDEPFDEMLMRYLTDVESRGYSEKYLLTIHQRVRDICRWHKDNAHPAEDERKCDRFNEGLRAGCKHEKVLAENRKPTDNTTEEEPKCPRPDVHDNLDIGVVCPHCYRPVV